MGMVGGQAQQWCGDLHVLGWRRRDRPRPWWRRQAGAGRDEDEEGEDLDDKEDDEEDGGEQIGGGEELPLFDADTE